MAYRPSLLPTLLPLLFASTYAAQITAGPLAQASIYSLEAYATARPCAADCLWDNGGIPCNAGAFYNDVAIALGCGCGAINACYCSAGLGSRATSIIQSCVSAQCDGLGDIESDVTSMLGLYGSYCATANVPLSTSAPVSKQDMPTTSVEALVESTADSIGAGAGVTASRTNHTSKTRLPTPTSTSSPVPEPREDEGLSKSDIIALGTGLGVGVPSIIIAIVALVIQLRKRNNRNHLSDGASSLMGSQTHILRPLTPLPTQTPPQQHVHMPYQGPYHGSLQGLAPARPQIYHFGGHVGGRWP